MTEVPEKLPVLPAATVVIIRDAKPQYDIFMLKRTSKAVFAGGMHVFPGGMVDDGDGDARYESIVSEPSDDQAGQAAAVGPKWRDFWLAGIRETFEEGGFLLAYDESGDMLSYTPENEQRFMDYRDAVFKGEVSLYEVCEREKLTLALDRIHFYNRLITPPGRPRRFDTHFFVTLAPPSQTGLHDGFETVDSLWISPQDALERHADETFGMMGATARQLTEFNAFKDTKALMEVVETRGVFPTFAPARVPPGR
jgi:8-oxo-dGTP pyrophosphatase MutT (NUDIX family)